MLILYQRRRRRQGSNLTKVQRQSRSDFGERVAFARWWQSGSSLDETDGQFASALGYRSPATVAMWRQRAEALPEETCAAIAKRTGVDARWLQLGADGASIEPPLFAKWLKAYRRGQAARPSETVRSGAPRLERSRPVAPPVVLPKARSDGP
jgi:hypothetical protein